MDIFYRLLQTSMLSITTMGLVFMLVRWVPLTRMGDVIANALFAAIVFVYMICLADFRPGNLLGPFGLVDNVAAIVAGVWAVHLATR